jgi:2-polyprenyl-3-methyl-5-hydroxy-6-metoxy-1,4-benzoquinol methylase
MDSQTAGRLIELNRQFYQTFGHEFSEKRQRLQPGVQRVLELIKPDEAVLDLGCGNGGFLLALARRGHRAPLLGLDFSLPLLEAADRPVEGIRPTFLQADLSKLSAVSDQLFLMTDHWSLITCFAVMHHIPSAATRLGILREVHKLLSPGGRFIHSEWQFLSSERLRARLQPWNAAGLDPADVDEGDALLDWRHGGTGLRYVHHFSEVELANLASQSGFVVQETFYSDGENHRLGLYQVWKKPGQAV